LKNAIDTCRYKREITDDQEYEPKLKFKKENNRLIVSDNGLGMDRHHVEYYLTVTGRIFYVSDEFSLPKQKFIPLSEIGIGILSYFLIANMVEIETKAHNSDALRIVIDDSSDYFLVYPSSKYQEGAVVTLYLKEESSIPRDRYALEDEKEYLLRLGSFYDIITHYARRIEFPIIYEENTEKNPLFR
jgi:HSP90 family molecular chaperone